MKLNIRLLYLYLFSFVGLMFVVFGSVQMVDLGLKAFVFMEADIYEYPRPVKVEGEPEIDEEEQRQIQKTEQSRQRQRQLSTALSMIAVGMPLYWYHWKTIEKERKG